MPFVKEAYLKQALSDAKLTLEEAERRLGETYRELLPVGATFQMKRKPDHVASTPYKVIAHLPKGWNMKIQNMNTETIYSKDLRKMVISSIFHPAYEECNA